MKLVIGVLFWAASAGTSSVPVRVEIAAGAASHAIGPITVRAKPLAYPGQETRKEQVTQLDHRAGSLNLAPGYWSLRAEADGAWGPAAQLQVPHAQTPVVLRLWPSARVSGHLTATDDALPDKITMVFQSTPLEGVRAKDWAVPQGEVECPVAQGAWSCEVPAGEIDLQLRAKPFVPHYLWDIGITPRAERNVGTHAFRRGASVAGFVVNQDGSAAGTTCAVELKSPNGEPIRSPGDPERRPWTAALNQRGFFQFGQVAPADYQVVASCPTGAFDMTAMRVLADAEFLPARPLTLRHPTAVIVEVTPPTDSSGRPWSVDLRRPREPILRLAPAGAAEPGRFKRDGVLPGRYALLVTAGDGRTRSHVEQIDLPAPSVIRIDIPSVSVRGTLRLGGEPLSADLHFGGESGFVRVTLTADEDGKFAGVLPRPGPWDVDVDATTPLVRRALKLQVADDGQDLEIDLPDSWLKGVVEDEAGVPLASMISVQKGDGEELLQTPTGEDGRFEMRGLVPGRYKVWAQAQGEPLQSDVLPVMVEAGREDPTLLRLVVRRIVHVKAQVVHGAAGVPGAHITVGSSWPVSPRMLSDAEGRFEVHLPPGNRELGLNVGALGYAFRILQAAVPRAGEPLLVPLDRTGGRLSLDLSKGIDPFFAVLIHEGYFESVRFLEPWAAANGGGSEGSQVTIPQMEPGAYRACFVRPGENAGLTYRVLTSKRCVEGTLPPGGELNLVLPRPEM